MSAKTTPLQAAAADLLALRHRLHDRLAFPAQSWASPELVEILNRLDRELGRELRPPAKGDER